MAHGYSEQAPLRKAYPNQPGMPQNKNFINSKTSLEKKTLQNSLSRQGGPHQMQLGEKGGKASRDKSPNATAVRNPLSPQGHTQSSTRIATQQITQSQNPKSVNYKFANHVFSPTQKGSNQRNQQRRDLLKSGVKRRMEGALYSGLQSQPQNNPNPNLNRSSF